MWERLEQMLVKEFIQILRDQRMKAVVFGYAVATGVTQVAKAVADFDQTQEVRELVRRFDSSGYFRVVRRVGEAGALRDLLDRGTV